MRCSSIGEPLFQPRAAPPRTEAADKAAPLRFTAPLGLMVFSLLPKTSPGPALCRPRWTDMRGSCGTDLLPAQLQRA